MSKWAEIVTVANQALADTDAEHPKSEENVGREIEEKCGCKRPGHRALCRIMKGIQHFRPEIQRVAVGSAWFMEQSYTETEVLLANDVVKSLRLYSYDEKQGFFLRLVNKAFPAASKLLRRSVNDCSAGRGNLPDNFRQMIEQGIQQNRRIQFYYLALDPYAKPFRKHNGKLYVVTPYDCFFANETLYVIASEEIENKVKFFRVDRMDELCLTSCKGEPIQKYFAHNSREKLADMKARMVNCFYGEKIRLELSVKYSEKAMDILYDLIGDKLEVISYNLTTNCSRVRFTICRSITLTGWLLQNHEFFTVLSPRCVIDDMLAIGRAVCATYADAQNVEQESLFRHDRMENVGKEMTYQDRICALVINNPVVTTVEIADRLGVSSRTIEREIQYLRKIGRIVRIGGRKCGHWQVND